MQYIVCTTPGQLELKEKTEASPNSGEALLAIRRVGICGTDLHAYGGRQPFFTYPRILGHELAAEVIDPGHNAHVRTGDKVVPIPYLHCGECIACRQGKTNCCQTLKVVGVHVDGGMQERFAMPHHLLIPTPQLSYEQMAIVEPLAIGAHAVRRAALRKEEKVVVVGAGPIGLGIMKFALIEGAEVIAMDINPGRLQFAKDVIGVQHTVVAGEGAVEELSEMTWGDLATSVFDATGNRHAMEKGTDYMAHGGRYILVGLFNGALQLAHPALHAKETSLYCSRNATREDFEWVIDVLSRDLFPTGSYITHQVDYREMVDRFESWTDPANQVIKAMTNWSS